MGWNRFGTYFPRWGNLDFLGFLIWFHSCLLKYLLSLLLQGFWCDNLLRIQSESIESHSRCLNERYVGLRGLTSDYFREPQKPSHLVYYEGWQWSVEYFQWLTRKVRSKLFSEGHNTLRSKQTSSVQTFKLHLPRSVPNILLWQQFSEEFKYKAREIKIAFILFRLKLFV